MPTVKEDPPAPPTKRERVARVVAAPIERIAPLPWAVAGLAALASLAPDPFGVVAVALAVIVASDSARRR